MQTGIHHHVPVARVFAPLLAPARYKGAHGGRGSGKSHFFSDKLISQMTWSDTKAICLREYQTSLQHSVKSLLEAKIKSQRPDDWGDFFDIKKTHIEGKLAGSLAVFHGMQAHNSDSLKSFEDFDIAWFEEAHRASAYSLEILRPTLRKEDSELWFSWNRVNKKDPVEQLFYPADGQRFPGMVSVEANWRDNPWITKALIEEMRYDRRRDQDRYKHVWEGMYRKHSEAAVFKNWDVQHFEIEKLRTEGVELYGPYLGADWGFSIDPTVLVAVWVDELNKKVYVRYEAWALQCKIQDTPRLFRQVPGVKGVQIIADSARPETIDYMRDQDFVIVGAKKGPGSLEDGVEFLKSYDIVVHPECPHVQDELTHYSYKVDKLTDEVTNQLEDKKNHTIDALRYALENVRRGHGFF